MSCLPLLGAILAYFGPIWCVIFYFLRTVQHFFMKFFTDFSKFYCPYLWIEFNCFKPTELFRADSLLFTTKFPKDPALSITLMVLVLLWQSLHKSKDFSFNPPLLGAIFIFIWTHVVFRYVS